jgi:hypothetical protein
MVRRLAVIAETDGLGVAGATGAVDGPDLAVGMTGAVVMTEADSGSAAVNGTGGSMRTGADSLSAGDFDSPRTGADPFPVRGFGSAETEADPFSARDFDSPKTGADPFSARDFESPRTGADSLSAREFGSPETVRDFCSPKTGANPFLAQDFDSPRTGADSLSVQDFGSPRIGSAIDGVDLLAMMVQLSRGDNMEGEPRVGDWTGAPEEDGWAAAGLLDCSMISDMSSVMRRPLEEGNGSPMSSCALLRASRRAFACRSGSPDRQFRAACKLFGD